MTLIERTDNVERQGEDGAPIRYYMEKRLVRNLEKVRLRVRTNDEDVFWVVDGPEGSGKSTFAFQVAKFLDESFCVDRIVFTAKDFRNAIIKAKKFECIVFDEAFRGLSSRSALNEINKMLVELMMECRQKNLFIIIVLPSFFMVDKYVALHRASGLFHVYKTKRGKRGQFMYFNERKKKLLYIKGKALYSYAGVHTDFKGRFFGQYAVNREEYLKKKLGSFNTSGKVLRSEELLRQRNLLLWYLNRKMGLSTYEMSDELKKIGWAIRQNSISEAVVAVDRDITMRGKE